MVKSAFLHEHEGAKVFYFESTRRIETSPFLNYLMLRERGSFSKNLE